MAPTLRSLQCRPATVSTPFKVVRQQQIAVQMLHCCLSYPCAHAVVCYLLACATAARIDLLAAVIHSTRRIWKQHYSVQQPPPDRRQRRQHGKWTPPQRQRQQRAAKWRVWRRIKCGGRAAADCQSAGDAGSNIKHCRPCRWPCACPHGPRLGCPWCAHQQSLPLSCTHPSGTFWWDVMLQTCIGQHMDPAQATH